jgi:arabinan endo-1,5-alpha-L-arabinosidase
MVKDGGRYWIFTTGVGIWNMSSDNPDFTTWQVEPLIFPSGTWPDWINTYVPGFSGNFWAPEIIYMNDKWYLYYSCSTFGSQQSAIGVVTSSSIADPDWQDQGMVVYSDNTWDVNAIDPDIFRDNEGKVWLIYGSWWAGIVMTEIDSLTGKPIDPNDLHHIANNGCEAGHMESHDGYYYLFFNRGTCCSGINSTYYILVGRSTSPTGPFYDKDSLVTNDNGGSLFLHSDGRYLGPGHFGYGEDRLTYHYYDGAAGGTALLKVATLEWDNDWPVAVYSRSYGIEDGTYVLTNYNSNKVLAPLNGDTISGTRVGQYTLSGETSQRWEIAYIGEGCYKISPLLAPDKALEIEECATSNGGKAQIGNYVGKECQKWYFAYMGSGIYRIMARHSRKALEIANASEVDGAVAQQNPYRDDRLHQRWTVNIPMIVDPICSGSQYIDGFSVIPNPSDGNFSIELSKLEGNRDIHLEIYSIEGKRMYSGRHNNTNTITFSNFHEKGIYIVKITDGAMVMVQKLIVN